jgi:predicted transcriptional regulator
VAELPDLLREVLAAVQAQKPPARIRSELGISAQSLTNAFGKLRDRGLIRRAEGGPRRGTWPAGWYAWEVIHPPPGE